MASGYLHPVGLDSLEVCRVNPALRYLEAGFLFIVCIVLTQSITRS